MLGREVSVIVVVGCSDGCSKRIDLRAEGVDEVVVIDSDGILKGQE